MNTKALVSLADLICRAQEQDRTPMGIAFAIDAAGRHMSPEVAAEMVRLRARVAELEAGIAWRDAERDRWSGVRYLVEKAIDKGWSSVDTFDLEDALGPEPAASQVAAKAPGRCPVAALGEAVDGEHYASVHHSYRTPRDLPELGGAR